MSQTVLNVVSFYCKSTRSHSLKISITFPNDVPNLAYNFILKLTISQQKLLPRLSYSQICQQIYHLPKKQIIVNHLQPKKMYQVKIEWKKYGKNDKEILIKDEKTFSIYMQQQEENESGQNDGQFQQQNANQSYSKLVKQNIRDYFNQYHQLPERQSFLPQHKNYSQRSLSSLNKNIQNSKEKSSIYSQKNKNNPIRTPLSSSQSLVKVIGQNDPLINKKRLQKYIIDARKSSSASDYLKTKDFLCFNPMNKLYKNQKQRREHMQKTLLMTKAVKMFGQIYAFDRQHGIDSLNEEQKKGRQFFKNEWFMGPFYSYNGNQKQMRRKKDHNDGED